MRQLHGPHGFLVEIDSTGFAHGADGIFRRFGGRDLAGNEHVQRQMERQTHLMTHHHPSAREREHNRMMIIPIGLQMIG